MIEVRSCRSTRDRHRLRRIAQTCRARSCQWPESRADGRGRGRMARRLSMVQSGQTHGVSRCRAGIKTERVGAALLSAFEQGASFFTGMARASGKFRRRSKRVDRFLWVARDFEAAFLLRADARSNERQPSVGRIGISPRKSQTLGPAQSRHLDRSAGPVSGPPVTGQRRPRGHALLGRSSLPVPG